MSQQPILDVRFFRTEAGAEPVRDWLRTLSATDKKAIGEDIKTVQFGWPLGMPLVGHVGVTFGKCGRAWIAELPELCS